MPKTTVYIRERDWTKWQLIENKAELISQAINRSVITPSKTPGKTIQEVPDVVYEEFEG